MDENVHDRIRILDRWDVRRHRLPSGLAVLLLEDRTSPLISYHTWFGVGSRHEKQGKTGLAHLFEHLMFESTANHPSGKFDRELERFGADTNAATWLDWTYYHETFPPEALDLVLTFEQDRMVNLILDEGVVEREKSVVMNERKYRVEDRIEGQIEEVMYRTAFKVNPYKHPTIGWMEDIKGFTVEDCRDFYKTFYSPGNAVIAVAGNFEHDELLGRIEKAYGGIPGQKIPEEIVGQEPVQETERRVTFSKEVSASKVAVGYLAPALEHFDNACLTILSVILCGGESGRLVRRFIHREEIASDVISWLGKFKLPALFEFHVDLRKDQPPDRAIALLDEEIDKLGREGVSEVEMSTARNRVLLGTYGGFLGVGGKAAALGFYETVTGDCNTITTRLEDLRRVTAEDVRAAAGKYFDPCKRTIVTVMPAKP
ncbi:MAG: pitrilysin family protein [Pseudomonadota bacterium]